MMYIALRHVLGNLLKNLIPYVVILPEMENLLQKIENYAGLFQWETTCEVKRTYAKSFEHKQKYLPIVASKLQIVSR